MIMQGGNKVFEYVFMINIILIVEIGRFPFMSTYFLSWQNVDLMLAFSQLPNNKLTIKSAFSRFQQV